MKKIFCYILLISFLFSCSGSTVRENLMQADKVMEENPDSALKLLQEIDTMLLKSTKQRGEYSMLMTQARVKTHEKVTDKSLITPAVEYYEGHGTDFNKLRTSFYAGKIDYYNEDYTGAIVDAIKAYELAKNYGDPYWIAKTAELLADIYSFNYLSEKAIEMFEIAADNYHKGGKLINERYSLCQLAIELVGKNNYQRSIEIADSIYKLAYADKDEALKDYTTETLLFIYFELGDKDNLKRIYDENYIETTHSINRENKFWYQSQWLMKENFEKTSQYLDSAFFYSDNEVSKSQTALLLAELYKQHGDHSKAKSYTDTVLYYQNLKISSLLNQSVIDAEKEYYENSAIENKHKREKLFWIIVAGSVAAVILILLIVFYSRLKIKNKNLELENNIYEIYRLTESLKESDSQKRFLVSEIERYKNSEPESETPAIDIREKWELLNKLCEDFMEGNTSEENKKSLFKKFDIEIKKLREEKHLSYLEEKINLCYNGLIKEIRRDCDFLKKDDIRIIIFQISGLSVRTIIYILGMNRNTFYSKRKRLIGKFEKMDFPSKERLLDLLKQS